MWNEVFVFNYSHDEDDGSFPSDEGAVREVWDGS